MTIRIVTDSTCDLPQEIIQKYNITVIPLHIHIGERELKDDVDITRQEFYKQLPDMRPHPTTAAPAVQVFRQIYERLAEDGATEILSIHISHKLSAIVNIATLASKETTIIPVTVFDSKQLSMGTGFEVLTAAQSAAEGHSMQEIVSQLEKLIPRIHVFAALDTLEYLRRSGRMNFALSTIGTILRIKPLLYMHNGDPTTEKIRTRKKAQLRLVELLYKFSPFEKVALIHASARELAQELLQEIKHILPEGEIWIEELNPALGAHLGPGVVGFACLSKNTGGGKL